MSRYVRALRAVNDMSQQEFLWGYMDCCTFAARVVAAVTGRKIEVGAEYSSETEAAELVASRGGLVAAISALLGDPIRDVSALENGDPVIVTTSSGDAVGVVLGERVVFKSARGVVSFRRSAARLGWRT